MPQPPQLRRSLAIPAEQSSLGGAPAVPDLRSFMGHRYPVAPQSPLAQSRLTLAATAAAVWPHTPIDGALAVFRPRAITAGRRSGDSCPTFSTTPSVPNGMPSRTRSRSLRESTRARAHCHGARGRQQDPSGQASGAARGVPTSGSPGERLDQPTYVTRKRYRRSKTRAE